MRRLPFLLATLAACSSTPDSDPVTPPPIGMSLPDDEVVARLNGRAITRREVTDRAMAVDGRKLVEDYAKWRVRQDRLSELGVTNTETELRARANVIIDAFRRSNGEAKFREQLAAAGFKTEEEYLATFTKKPEFSERLAVEKALVYDLIVEGSVEFEAVAFVDEQEATAFASKLRNGGDIEALLKDLVSAKVQIGRWPKLRVSREITVEAFTAAEWITKHLFELKDGQVSDVERTTNSYCLVIRCVKNHPPKTGSYIEHRQAVLDEVLLGRIQDPQLAAWGARLMKKAEFIHLKYQPPKK